MTVKRICSNWFLHTRYSENLILFANFSNRSCIWGHETTTYNTPSYSYNLLQNKSFPSKEKKWLVTKF